MKCEIIQDLLPNYVDDLTSTESNMEIEAHIKNCTNCKDILEKMQAEVQMENIEQNKEEIQPFKKLNKKVRNAVLTTVGICALFVGSYFYFFGIGWSVSSEDMNILYSKTNDVIHLEFELTNGRVLNAWTNHKDSNEEIKFTECFPSKLDDRGEYPNQFSYGIHYRDSNGGIKNFTDEDYVILKFKDKTQLIYWQDIAKALGI